MLKSIEGFSYSESHEETFELTRIKSFFESDKFDEKAFIDIANFKITNNNLHLRSLAQRLSDIMLKFTHERKSIRINPTKIQRSLGASI